MEIDRNKYLALTNETYFDCLGRVTKVVGLTIESVGPDAKLNDLCRIFVGGDRSQAVMAQVVGFRDKHLPLTVSMASVLVRLLKIPRHRFPFRSGTNF